MNETNDIIKSIRTRRSTARDEMEAGAAYDASFVILDTLRSYIFPEGVNSSERYKEIMNEHIPGAVPETDTATGQGNGKNKKNKIRKNILLFFPVGRETAIHPIFRDLLNAGYNLYFPKTYKDKIEFFKINSLNGFTPGRLDIPEPIGNTDKWKNSFYGICLVPGLAFDRHGNRIGHGLGYYDKFLSDEKGLIKIGICYENQMEDSIPAEEWDVPMDIMITEAGLFDLSKKE